MIPRSGFIISIFLTVLLTPFSSQAQDRNCRKVDVTVDVTSAQGGQGGTIKVSAKDSQVTFMLHLLTKGKGKKNDQLSITTGTIENIPPGTYDLVIHYADGTYCSETRKVTVN